MRTVLVVFCCLVVSIPLSGQSQDEDPYSLHLVENNLRAAAIGHGGEWAGTTGVFQRLGDGVSIALLKILDSRDLEKPATIQNFLPLIRQSFSYPRVISPEINRNPKITLFLLNYLQRTVSDARTLDQIQGTRSFVLEQSGTNH